MPRPGRNIEEALLRSGRELYAQHGCAGLSVRLVAGHAGATAGMFHYHFASKDAFLQILLQRYYDEMFVPLSDRAMQSGPALARLRESLLFLALFVRGNAAVLGRIFADAASGQEVAVRFLRANAPRHLRLLLQLMQQAETDGQLAPLPPLQRFVFLTGAVALPVVIAPRIAAMKVAPAIVARRLKAEVTSDAAIAQRVDLALSALRSGVPS